MVVALGGVLVLGAHSTVFARGAEPIMRVELHLAPDARTRPHVVLMTLGGPIYCVQLRTLARRLRASLVCADYGRNGYEGRGERTARMEDWGDPAYLDQVATLPAKLRAKGVKIAKLALVGVSYSGYANAELVATHPEMRPDALVVVDSYLDLAARFRALLPSHLTRREMTEALGGAPDERPDAYAQPPPGRACRRDPRRDAARGRVEPEPAGEAGVPRGDLLAGGERRVAEQARHSARPAGGRLRHPDAPWPCTVGSRKRPPCPGWYRDPGSAFFPSPSDVPPRGGAATGQLLHVGVGLSLLRKSPPAPQSTHREHRPRRKGITREQVDDVVVTCVDGGKRLREGIEPGCGGGQPPPP